jgi:hypothetical protein
VLVDLAHELAQNNVVVVYFAVMLPEQVLAKTDVLVYFDSVRFLCLACPTEVLRARLASRDGIGAAMARGEVWTNFNSTPLGTASETPNATIVDAGRTTDEVEHDVRHWIDTQLHRHGALEH